MDEFAAYKYKTKVEDTLLKQYLAGAIIPGTECWYKHKTARVRSTKPEFNRAKAKAAGKRQKQARKRNRPRHK